MIIYFAVYFGILINYIEGIWRYILIAVHIVFALLIVVVCIERIKEIKKGEEDDISKY